MEMAMHDGLVCETTRRPNQRRLFASHFTRKLRQSLPYLQTRTQLCKTAAFEPIKWLFPVLPATIPGSLIPASAVMEEFNYKTDHFFLKFHKGPCLKNLDPKFV
jgi:hypothetical protein